MRTNNIFNLLGMTETDIYVRKLGPIPIIKAVLDKIRLIEVVDKYSPMKRERNLTHGVIIEVLVINRLTSPRPLYQIEEWARNSDIGQIYQIDPGCLNDDRIASALDAIHPHIKEIEAELATNTITVFGLDSDIIHFDLTSLYVEGDYEDSDLITFGYNRDGKKDKEQINLGLNVTSQEGVPVAHDTYKGNTTDEKTVISNMKRLKEILKNDNQIIVGDRKMLTPPNIASFHEVNCYYIGALKLEEEHKDLIRSIREEEFCQLEYSRHDVIYKACEREITVRYEKKEYHPRAIIIKSSEKERKDRDNRKEGVEKINKSLLHIQSLLNQRKYKRYEYVYSQIQKARKGKYKKYIGYELSGKDGALELKVWIKQDEIDKDSVLDGKYILITNVEKERKDANGVLFAYKSQFLVENRIKNCKQDLKIRPIFLHSDNRIQSLIFVNVISLMVYSILEVLVRRAGFDITTRTLFQIFEMLSSVHIRVSENEWLIRITTLTPLMKEIIEKTSLPHPERYFG